MKAWLVVDVPQMDCSDRVILGPYVSAAAAQRVLRDKDTRLARGVNGVDAYATIIVGKAVQVRVSRGQDGKRILRRVK